jgi:ABC-type transporter Mla MlaB component
MFKLDSAHMTRLLTLLDGCSNSACHAEISGAVERLVPWRFMSQVKETALMDWNGCLKRDS